MLLEEPTCTDTAESALFAACRQALAIGTRAPAWSGMAADRSFYSAEVQFGRSVVMLLAPVSARDVLRPVLEELARLASGLASHEADLVILTDSNPALLRTIAPVPAEATVIDCGAFLSRRGLGGPACAVILADRNQRIAYVWRPGDPPDFAQPLRAQLARLPREAPVTSAMPAPVLVLPNLLSPDLCAHLIGIFKAAPSQGGRFARTGGMGTGANSVGDDGKTRRDLVIDDDSLLYADLRAMLLSRCRGEIAKAFRANVTQSDRIVLACYDAGAGGSPRHRNDQGTTVAFREFALSITLNAGYAGGGLLFPEYSDTRIMPPAGGAVVFSASILHEVTPVTAGRRYGLLTFLYGDPRPGFP